MHQRILVPFDGSATSSRGVDEAIGIAKLTGASLRLIHMLDILDFTSGFETAGDRSSRCMRTPTPSRPSC